MLREIARYDKIKKETNTGNDDQKKVVTNIKEGFLEEIFQNTMFDEVYKN